MKDAKFTGGQTCQVSFLSSWEKEMNQKSRFQPADCDLRSALQPPLRAARVWRQGVGVEGKGKGGSCVMFSHQNCLRAGRVAGQGYAGWEGARKSGGVVAAGAMAGCPARSHWVERNGASDSQRALSRRQT